MKAIIWGSCGSLPSPSSPAQIRQKVAAALWAARREQFEDNSAVEAFLNTLPLSLRGTYKGNTSCVQIDAGPDEVILCDAGSGIRDYALSLGENPKPKTYHIFISHLHWDHIQGFPFFKPAYEAGNRIIFHGFHSAIESCIKDQMKAPCFPVPFEAMQAEIEFDIREDGARFDLGATQVKTIRQSHPGDSWGYRFEHDGKAIVYSTDSEHGPAAQTAENPFIQFFKNADILIMDGQYTREEAINEKRDWGHSDHVTAVELAARAEARTLIIFHHEPAYSDSMIETIFNEAQTSSRACNATLGRNPEDSYPVELLLAHDGLRIEA